jgi:hypothetical protein
MLAVVVADVEIDGEYPLRTPEGRDQPRDLRKLADRLVERDVEEVVSESTAQSWRPSRAIHSAIR